MAQKFHLPYILLPHYYTKLLIAKSNSSSESFSKTIQYIYDTPSLYGLMNAFLIDPDSKVNPDSQLKAIGWLGVRDRLALLFLERERGGTFCQPTDQAKKDFEEILDFERRTREISVEGHSRGFLLAFYLKMLSLRQGTATTGGENLFGVIPRPLLHMLVDVKARAIRIDWLFLFSLHIYQHRGQAQCKELLKKGTPFSEVWPKGVDALAGEIIQNLLRYGASIGELDFLCSSLAIDAQRSKESDSATE